jgi:Carboxypeptidase regulatory-like domain/TonB dependent receptor
MKRSHAFVRVFVILGAVLALPVIAAAQEAVLTGTITDSTGAVLPGVTVQATHEASGNNYEAVTDGRGVYRIPVRVGSYKITAQLTGFGNVTRMGVELLVGQTITLNLQMAPSTLQETVTVTGEAPLIETQSSEIGGNIDPRQVQDLPTAGRNWMSLALLAPGNRTNAQGSLPVQDRVDVREFQLNVDGLQVTANLGTGNQSRYSNDAIAEFQFISNWFDATQGRSSGVQVNAITRSGTNALAGTFVGNFRDSRWNSADPVLDTKVPYKNQQYSATVGGPIVLNKLHYFANYEYEHQPLTSIWNTAFAPFNVTLHGTHHVDLSGIRVDDELSSKMRLMGKVNHSSLLDPFGTGSANHPSGTAKNQEHSTDALGELTHVLSNKALNTVRVGYASYGINQSSLTTWSQHWQAANGITNGGPNLTFRGFRTGRNGNIPRYRDQNTYTIHDDFTYSYDARGHHDLKAGGEYLHLLDNTRNCNQCGGTATVNGGAIPANITSLLPDPFNADTWQLASPDLGAIATRYSVGVSDSSNFLTPVHMWKYGAWAQDDWKATNKLTLNLGVRYDLIWNAFAQNVTFLPFELANRPQDANNLQPRLGFAYRLTDRTVLRGGAGLYYNDELNTNVLWPMSPLTIAVVAIDNTTPRRADFVANPFNGPLPTYDQALARFCNAGGGRPDNPAYTAWAASGFAGAAPCLLRDLQEQAPIPDYSHVTHSWQSSIGIAQQLGNTAALQVDYVQTNSRNEKSIQDNINLTFNPATGIPYPYSDVAHRAYPMFGVVGAIPHTGISDYYGVQSSLTKRMSNRWQANVTYTLGWLYDRDAPPLSGLREYTGTVPVDLGGERSLAATDQRHRAVFNGIWDVGGGFQVSGIYFYGSGQREQILCGCDARGLQIASIDRLRGAGDTQGPAGSIIPRNSFVDQPIHRVETRLLQRIPLHGKANLAGSLEVFNLFNRKNYGAYDLTETSPTFGAPQPSANLSYAPRTVQLGFRLTY